MSLPGQNSCSEQTTATAKTEYGITHRCCTTWHWHRRFMTATLASRMLYWHFRTPTSVSPYSALHLHDAAVGFAMRKGSISSYIPILQPQTECSSEKSCLLFHGCFLPMLYQVTSIFLLLLNLYLFLYTFFNLLAYWFPSF